MSFGGPEKPEDVVPFLENVTAGRGIPRERLVEVGQHYSLFGGRSPINDLNRDLLAGIEADLAAAGIDLPVYWGNRNWDPYLTDALQRMKDDGVTRAACFVTSAYSSWSSCRQYRENLYDAAAAVPGAPALDKLRHYFNHPGFVEPVVDAALAALADLPAEIRDDAHLVFVTHSIPLAMAESAGPTGGAYVAQHRDVAAEVVVRVTEESGVRHPHELVFCSRSGSPHVPWLEPDVNDHLEALAKERRARASCWSRSDSSLTTWRSSTTSTPRRSRPPSGSACPPVVRPPPAPTPASSPWSATCCSSGPRPSGATTSSAPASARSGRCGTAARSAAAPTLGPIVPLCAASPHDPPGRAGRRPARARCAHGPRRGAGWSSPVPRAE